MEGLRLEVEVAPLLAGVGACQQLGHLLLDVTQNWTKLLEGLGLDPGYRPGEWRVHQDLVAHLEGEVSELLQAPVVEVSAVSAVGGAAHEDREEDDPPLLGGLVQAAGPSLVPGQVAGTVGTEGAPIADRGVEDFVPVYQLEVPVSQRGDARIGERAHGLVPLLHLLHYRADVNLDILHVLDRKTAFHLIHLLTSL